jgi:hypothetical protein
MSHFIAIRLTGNHNNMHDESSSSLPSQAHGGSSALSLSDSPHQFFFTHNLMPLFLDDELGRIFI